LIKKNIVIHLTIYLYFKKEIEVNKKNEMKYKVLKLKEDILFYIPHKENMKVIDIQLIEKSLKLKYNESKSYTIKELNNIAYNLMNNKLDKYIVEINKEQKIVKTYKINFHKKK
jgi:hypothetical protein